MDNKYVIKKLKNGITLLVIPLNINITKIEVKILLGAQHEKKEELELTHYMEHLMAVFTSYKYKNSLKNKIELNKRGADSNASVSDNETIFYITGFYKDLEFYVDLLSNTINNFYIDDTIVDNEKNAVIQENNNYIVKYEYIFDLKVWRYFFKKYGYQYDSNEKIKNIKKFKVSKIYNYIKNHILLKNIIVSVICPIGKENKTLNLLSKAFNFKKESKKDLVYPSKIYKPITSEIIHINNKNKKETNNVLLRIYVNKNIIKYSKKYFTIMILRNILFNFETGPFYNILRSRLGIIYNINFSYELDLNNPKLSKYAIYTSADKKNVPLLIQNIFKIFKEYVIMENEIDSAKNRIKINYEKNKLYDLDYHINYYSSFLVYKRDIIKIKDCVNTINNITYNNILNEFNEMSNDILNKSITFYYGKDNLNNKIKEVVDINIKYKNIL
jgi:predicted Zn-dependent peptidase